ncbi:hypothetical protein [Treponema sp.]|uniref:hypothetical protein n=1 Tax=Treponema sp. TaxID=166 RepID=UPI00257FF2A9|nr:hypothetical protein [Treponema sp.]MBE6353898.1 hypothetical protein [Treponema sp.]
MIVHILLSFLFILLITALLFFIFSFFIPSLKDQNVNTSSLVFSRLEENVLTGIKEPEMEKARYIAVIKTKKTADTQNFIYKGIQDCSIYFETFEKGGIYSSSCIGFGSCIKSCSRNAIIIRNNTAEITPFCDGCGECLSSCPKKLISLVDRNKISEETSNNRGKLFKLLLKCYKILGQDRA